MNIIHILWNFTSGGVQNMLIDIVNEQSKKNGVTIIAIDSNPDERLLAMLDNRVEFISLGRISGKKDPFVILRLNFEIWRRNLDIIHVHMQGITKWIYSRKPIVATIHNAFERNASKEYDRYQKIFSISEAVKQYTLNVNNHDSVVVYNGINTEKINCTQVKKLHSDGYLHFVEIGRLTKIKGQLVVLEAFNILINQLGYKKIKMDFIGDGDLKPEMESLIHKYNLEGHVQLLGMRTKDDIYPILCNYDCYIQPSISEGFGLTIVEAMCAKLPIITSNLEGPMEVIGGGRYGRSFISENVEDLVSAIVDYLQNPTTTEQIESAYHFAKENFNISKVVAKYESEYTNLNV